MFFLLLATIKEALFRAAFMEIMNSSSFVYPIVKATPKLILIAIIAAGVFFSAPLTRKGLNRWVAALVISALAFFVCKPVVDSAFGNLLKRIEWLSSPSLYDPPYDYHILIPAYLSFLEPVFCELFHGGADLGEATRARETPRGSVYVAGVETERAGLRTLHQHSLCKYRCGKAMLSEGQFSFESIALGALTALSWWAATRSEQKVSVNSGVSSEVRTIS